MSSSCLRQWSKSKCHRLSLIELANAAGWRTIATTSKLNRSASHGAANSAIGSFTSGRCPRRRRLAHRSQRSVDVQSCRRLGSCPKCRRHENRSPSVRATARSCRAALMRPDVQEPGVEVRPDVRRVPLGLERLVQVAQPLRLGQHLAHPGRARAVRPGHQDPAAGGRVRGGIGAGSGLGLAPARGVGTSGWDADRTASQGRDGNSAARPGAGLTCGRRTMRPGIRSPAWDGSPCRASASGEGWRWPWTADATGSSLRDIAFSPFGCGAGARNPGSGGGGGSAPINLSTGSGQRPDRIPHRSAVRRRRRRGRARALWDARSARAAGWPPGARSAYGLTFGIGLRWRRRSSSGLIGEAVAGLPHAQIVHREEIDHVPLVVQDEDLLRVGDGDLIPGAWRGRRRGGRRRRLLRLPGAAPTNDKPTPTNNPRSSPSTRARMSRSPPDSDSCPWRSPFRITVGRKRVWIPDRPSPGHASTAIATPRPGGNCISGAVFRCLPAGHSE